MKMKNGKKISSFILCMALMVAMALFTTGCNGGTGNGTTSAAGTGAGAQAESGAQTENDTQAEDDAQAENDTQAKGDVPAETDTSTESDAQAEDNALTDENQLGEGSTKFMFTVVDKEGNETQFEIHTDQETVGGALTELGMIEGEESEYGLYVKTVNGITADYDKDGVYWAFYVNDEYAPTGVDSTAITEGDSYSFRVE